MMYRVYLFSSVLVALILSLGFSLVTLAATDNFTIQQQITGADVTPPTVPMNLTATPVALSQIDLAWSASSDNIGVTGYQVFRDNLQIATSAAVTYSDVGLAASTTYTYYVTAFDAALNYSASSTEVSTTTLASSTPPAATPSVSSGGGAPKVEQQLIPIELTYLEVIPSTHSVSLEFGTLGFVKAVIKWGRTTSYEKGSLIERAFSQSHGTTITGLFPGTLYYFTIEGENHLGQYGILTASTFTTLSLDDTLPPSNVLNLRAYRNGEDIMLEWDNPKDLDFDRVRVLGSANFYPGDTADGRLVYEDGGELARDSGAAVPGTRQYYTVFSYDTDGNVSSGAVVAIDIVGDSAFIPVDVVDETLDEIDLSFSDIRFIQEGELLSIIDNTVTIDGTKRLLVELPYEAVPEHLKTILVTLSDTKDENKVFSFILRINAEGTAYSATLAPFGVAGTFPFRISVFDFQTSQIGYASGYVVSEIAYYPEPESGGFLSYVLSVISKLSEGYLIWFLLTLLAMLIVANRLLNQKDQRGSTTSTGEV